MATLAVSWLPTGGQKSFCISTTISAGLKAILIRPKVLSGCEISPQVNVLVLTSKKYGILQNEI
jgi:hypothetical protein